MTDITELAQSLKAAADREMICRDGAETSEIWERTVTPENILALVEALEKAQTINAAAEKLVRCKGRYHSEQNYRALAALFGVNTPDLPPLDDESHAVTVENLQESAYRAGLTAGWNLGLANNNEGFNKCLAAHTAGFKVKAE
ncbi:hypothetical protein ACTZT4_22340 [Klebsiella pneumoniae]